MKLKTDENVVYDSLSPVTRYHKSYPENFPNFLSIVIDLLGIDMFSLFPTKDGEHIDKPQNFFCLEAISFFWFWKATISNIYFEFLAINEYNMKYTGWPKGSQGKAKMIFWKPFFDFKLEISIHIVKQKN